MKTIEKGHYDGYIWMSDQTTPEVLFKEQAFEERVLDDDKNPFIIEAQLFDPVRGVSYSVKYVDSKHLLKRYEVSQDDISGKNPQASVEEYVAHRMKEVKALKFIQYWKPESDEKCCGMEVLVPQKKVFVGFIK